MLGEEDKPLPNRFIDIINLLKIDTEGNDYDVLKSCQNSLKNNIIELIKIEITNEGNNFQNILKFLNEFGYELIGSVNHTYFDNKLTLSDCYFQKN